MTPIGCAWLNKPSSLQSGGWASLAGGEVFKFSDITSLQGKGAIWVTQCAQKTFIAEGGHQYPYLRHSEFLPTPLNFLAEELAVVDSPMRAPVALSEVLTRTVNLAINWMPDLERDLLDPALFKLTLHELLQLSIAPAGRSLDLPADLQSALHQLFPAVTHKDPAYIDLFIRVPADRVALYENVMTLSIPGDTWAEIPKHEHPPNPLTWAISGMIPIIAQVIVIGPRQRSKDKDGSNKTSGYAIGDLKKGSRRWMARPEIEALSKIYELKAERVFICHDLLPASAALKIAPPIFSPVARSSISAGLFAESFLHAASTPNPISAVRDDGSPAFNPYSIRAIWLNSLARAEMFEAAMKLSESRVTILGVGTNHLFVGEKKARLRGLRYAITKNAGVSYPSGLKATEERFAPKSNATWSYENTGAEEGEAC